MRTQTSEPAECRRGTAQSLCIILQGAFVTLHIILLGVGGTIYNTHTLKPFKELGLDSQRVKKLVSKLHVHSVNLAAKLVQTRRPFPVLLSTLIRSRFQVKPATLLIPIDFSFPFCNGRALRYSYQSGSITLINVGSGFHCLRSFSFFFLQFQSGMIFKFSRLLLWFLRTCLLMRYWFVKSVNSSYLNVV